MPSPSSMSFTRSALLHFRETFQILFAIPRTEGYRALFKGLGPNLIGVVPARAINFYTYGNGKRVLSTYFNDGKESAWVHLCAAATAGIVTGTATNPIWLVKTRLQLDKNNAKAQGGRQYKNALDCTMQTIRQEGIRGLYKGLTASYLGVSESTMQWVLYEQMKLGLANRQQRLEASGREPSVWDKTIQWTGGVGAAGFAKFIATILTYPHEVRHTPIANPICFPAKVETGGADSFAVGADGERAPEVHRSGPMLPTGCQGRRSPWSLWWSDAPSLACRPQRSHHVRYIRECAQAFGHDFSSIKIPPCL